MAYVPVMKGRETHTQTDIETERKYSRRRLYVM